ncbi:ribonuclease P protein component [Geodermatophilus africanus]|uniref:Ribonuclease P protein component n=2 Tax=Geodermatophilus africanus TaxID=1137993 RepID=A0A1H3L309_9ACTN|nr:ribonuclease P protein component [Geodermatophilus africanus]SDY97136.1 ribonuclease P protein component [Geodermatophilus africanus]
MVLHYLPERPVTPTPRDDAGTVGGPRAGLVVGRAVGNSVVRHRVTRRLRAVVLDQLDRLPPTADLVVRARPEAAAASSAELRRDLTAGLDRLLRVRTP